jgi:hypothetical protein
VVKIVIRGEADRWTGRKTRMKRLEREGERGGTAREGTEETWSVRKPGRAIE